MFLSGKQTQFFLMSIFELRNKTSEIENSLDDLNNTMKMTEKRICELANRSTEFTQFLQQRGGRESKKLRVSVPLRQYQKDLIFIFKSQKEGRKRLVWKKI